MQTEESKAETELSGTGSGGGAGGGGIAGLKKRMATAFGVTIFARGVTTLIQFLSVPIFLSHWGVTLYGEWLLLNTIPNYVGMSDVGFGSTAGNEMTMLMAAGKQEEALDVFQSVFGLTTVVTTTIGALFMAMIWFLPFNRWLKVQTISWHDTSVVILLLALSVLLSMQEILFQAAFRCVAKYSYGTFLKSLVQLGSFVGVALAVLLGGGVVRAAEVFLLTNAVGTLVLYIELRRNVPWIRLGFEHARWATLKRLWWPAISFMAFPVGNALSLQGMLIVIGHVLGPVAVVVFATVRTVSRTAIQVMQLVNNTVWPEMSAAVGAGNFGLARTLHRRSCQISIALGLAVIIPLVLLGPSIWAKWTMHRFPTDRALLDLMLLLVVFSSLWFTSSVALSATNRHQRLAVVYLIATSASLVAAWVLCHYFDLRGAAFALIGGEIFMDLFVLRASLSFLGDTFGGFMRGMLTVPKLKMG